VGAIAGDETWISRRILLILAGLEFFVCWDPTRNVKSPNMPAWGRDAPKRTREGRISQTDAPKKSWWPSSTYLSLGLCSNECDLQEASIFLDRGLFGVCWSRSWAGENAGNTHSKKSLALLLRARLRSFCFNQCDLHIWSRWAWVLWKDAMNRCRDGEKTMMRSQLNMLLHFIRLNMSLYVHVFAVRNRYASQVFCTCFVHARMSKCCLGVCPESGRIHNCMYNEGEMAPCRAYCWYMFYMAGMALRRGFDQSFSCMHALWKKGWLRADAGFSVFHAYAHA
jgi:hypothetical protein